VGTGSFKRTRREKGVSIVDVGRTVSGFIHDIGRSWLWTEIIAASAVDC
jgi:hypothetical protein